MQYQTQLSAIGEKLERLRVQDTSFKIGEAGEHRYQTNPVATEESVEAFEQKHSISLPKDYRAFIVRFANGGAGPGYGIYTIGESFAEHLQPQLPFPYAAGMRVPYSAAQTSSELKMLGAFYKDPRNEHGKIIIGEMGCGIMIDLIVNGPSKGQVWIDDRTHEWGGLYPCDQFKNTTPLEFLDWYELWLDSALKFLDDTG